MREDGLKENSMGKEDSFGQTILNIVEIIRLGRRVVKGLSFIHPEKPIKEAGSRGNNKEKEPSLVLLAKSLKKVYGLMGYSHKQTNNDCIPKYSLIYDYCDDNDRIKIFLKGFILLQC